MIRLKRAYDPPSRQDGLRILVERLWPRGVSKEAAAIDLWVKDIAPSTELRKWFHHDLTRWEQFRQRYIEELQEKEDSINLLKDQIAQGTVTFIYAASDQRRNSAIVLKEYLEKQKG
jgi:uncharacterized protein YeaO (DUF488 family)